MVAAPVIPARIRQTLGKTERLDVKDIQGIVASAYLHLEWSAYLLFRIDKSGSKDAAIWIAGLCDRITTAEIKDDSKSLNIAITAHGLRRLGVGRRIVNTFSVPFVDGMASKRRATILGDPSKLEWGGDDAPVDVLLMAYALTEPALKAMVADLKSDARRKGVTKLRILYGRIFEDRREHFGFVDGISQPIIKGLPNLADTPYGHRDVVKNGEFVLGYTNEYKMKADAPTLGPAGDLGKNGSYLVFRQTSQDVPGFWKAVEDAATGIGMQTEMLAAKMIGRWKSGVPLVKSPEADQPALGQRNDFGFKDDQDGLRCPLGAHIRRANPRNELLHAQSAPLKARSERHRLLRRGRPYGPRYKPEVPNDTERGLHFIALCGDLERQFEFVQQTWINNPAFNELDESDPLVGGPPPDPATKATFTIQAGPVRQRLPFGMQSFVQLKGGAYFFVPSIKALKWLGDPNRESPPGGDARSANG